MTPDGFEKARRSMVASQLRTNAVDDVRVTDAMLVVPREAFVPEDRRAVAYADTAVPLGRGRVLNAPMTTGRLLCAARIKRDDNVLVVAAGSGYVLAIAVLLARSVTGVESDDDLARQAMANVPEARVTPGPLGAGAPDGAPYDVIVIDGAVEHVPPALVEQLATGGRLATGLVERGVTRLALGHRGGTGFGVQAFADADIMILPGFAKAASFAF